MRLQPACAAGLVRPKMDVAVVIEEGGLDHFLDVARAEGMRPRISDVRDYAKRNAVLR